MNNQNDYQENVIYSTFEYDKFRMNAGIQRAISKTMIKNIIDSLETIVMPIPIIVNENFLIIDGHHLFIARRNKKLPILYYVVKGAGAKEVRVLNLTRKNWNSIDIINSFAESLNETMSHICLLLINNKIPSNIIPIILYKGGSSNSSKKLLKDFVNENTENFDNVANINHKIDIFNKYRKFTTNRNFYNLLFRYREFDTANMIDVISIPTYKTIIEKEKNLKTMFDVIKDLLNKTLSNSKQINIYFEGKSK